MRIKLTATAAALGVLGACSEPTVPDLNNPGRGEYQTITNRSQLQALATGLLDGDRDAYGTQVLFQEIMGRDLIRFDPAEPRYFQSLLGTSISNSDFVGNSTWTIPYSNIREARVIVSAVTAAQAVQPTPFTDPEKAATRGYALTVAGLQYMRLIETRDTNGVPIQGEEGADSLAALRCKPSILAYTSALLDSAATELTTAGPTTFPFALPSGFAGFSVANAASGTDFLAFNRGLKARVEMYRGFAPLQAAGDPLAAPVAANLTAALAAIDASFFNPVGTRAALDVGVYHTFSTASGENTTPLVDAGVYRANPRVITEGAEPGDLRIQAKVDTSANVTPLSNGTGATLITSRYAVRYPATPTDRLALMKNGELVLNRALILWGLGRTAEAIQHINLVRAAAGLPARSAGDFADRKALLLGILKEKRYELLFESPARHIDYRTFGILNELGRERGNNPLARFPIPNNEAVARNGNITCVDQ